jgi:phytoene dehydrogenase-like protein
MRAANLSSGRWTGVPGSDPGTGVQAFAMMDQLSGRPMPKGGSGMLSVALGRCIEANNGVILTSQPVAQLMIEKGQCVGVECVDGSQYRARKAVVCPKVQSPIAPPWSWTASPVRHLIPPRAGSWPRIFWSESQ